LRDGGWRGLGRGGWSREGVQGSGKENGRWRLEGAIRVTEAVNVCIEVHDLWKGDVAW
jgi:hypothetical protein